jgi:hypothetical protein
VSNTLNFDPVFIEQLGELGLIDTIDSLWRSDSNSMVMKDVCRNWRDPPHPKKKFLEQDKPYNWQTQEIGGR